jgi:hypothetical protein
VLIGKNQLNVLVHCSRTSNLLQKFEGCVDLVVLPPNDWLLISRVSVSELVARSFVQASLHQSLPHVSKKEKRSLTT